MMEAGKLSRRELLGAIGAATVVTSSDAVGASAGAQGPNPLIAFADREIVAAARAANRAALRVQYRIEPQLGSESYRFESASAPALTVVAGDAKGAMYGGLDIAEALRLGEEAWAALDDKRLRKPHIGKRGIKFNAPLDLRNPQLFRW